MTMAAAYKKSVTGRRENYMMNERGAINEGDISDDDIIEVREDQTWFGMGMSREEKIEIRRPW